VSSIEIESSAISSRKSRASSSSAAPAATPPPERAVAGALSHETAEMSADAPY
jgi:hypothetical protein